MVVQSISPSEKWISLRALLFAGGGGIQNHCHCSNETLSTVLPPAAYSVAYTPLACYQNAVHAFQTVGRCWGAGDMKHQGMNWPGVSSVTFTFWSIYI